MIKFSDCQQGSQEWLQIRSGKVTASKINDVMAKIKSGEAASRRDYRIELVTETLTGNPTPSGYISPEMTWGTEQEPLARVAYEIKTGNTVDQYGFVSHPSIERAGCSPDGVVQGEGCIEIKCPKTATHIGWILDGKVPSQHQNQMLFVMECCGQPWCDFVSFDPRLPDDLQLFIARLYRDESRVKEINEEVNSMLEEVDSIIERLKNFTGFAKPFAPTITVTRPPVPTNKEVRKEIATKQEEAINNKPTIPEEAALFVDEVCGPEPETPAPAPKPERAVDEDCRELLDLCEKYLIPTQQMAAYLVGQGYMTDPMAWRTVTAEGCAKAVGALKDPRIRHTLLKYLAANHPTT